MRRGTHTNESRHTHEWMSRVTNMNESCHKTQPHDNRGGSKCYHRREQDAEHHVWINQGNLKARKGTLTNTLLTEIQITAYVKTIDLCVSDIFSTISWRRCIGCLKMQVFFRKRAINDRAQLRKMTYKDKASNGSSPPIIYYDSKLIRELRPLSYFCSSVVLKFCAVHTSWP